MPAKIMKRPAAAASVVMKKPAAKKVKLDPLEEKCNLLVDAIAEAEKLPENTKTLLTECVPFVFKVYQADRHEYQNWVVEMVEETISGISAAQKKVVSETQAELDGIEEVKKARSAKAVEVAAKLAAAKERLTQLESKEQSDEKAVKEAEISLTGANVAKATADEALTAKIAEKEKLQDAFDNKYQPLKLEERPAGMESNIKDLMKMFQELKFEKSLCESYKMIVNKQRSEWGPFDHVVVGQVEEAFAKTIAKVEGEVQEGEAAKTAKQEAAAAAEAHLGAAKEVHAASLAAYTKGDEAAKDLAKELEAAEQAVTDFQADLKTICDKLDTATSTDSTFMAGPIAALEELKALAPPPEPEPVPEEVAEETKPEEEPAAASSAPAEPEAATEEATMVDAQVTEAAVEPAEGEPMKE